MDITHHLGIGIGYSAAIAATFLVAHVWRPGQRRLYPAVEVPSFARPWVEFLWAIIACVGIILLGQVYIHIWRVPNRGPIGWLGETVNQILIFAPAVVLLLVRRNPPESVFLARDRTLLRLGAGVTAGVLGVLAYAIVRLAPTDFDKLMSAFAQLDNVPHVVQILLEDIVIICLIVRLSASIGSFTVAGLIVIVLFVAAHCPALLAADAITTDDVMSLMLDSAIGAVVFLGLLRTRDLLWLWPLHTCMDLTQFVTTPTSGAA
ncbi:MAG: hypothetical protein L0Y44_03575 [Phycisphaerales bacterium]|nr:hypothetical protein [Phycisphaerales bacterium]MCI0629717.1 hypothetical protein [Phycisphaerales bacterium]MCI0674183.1 hypothetical protein [Phycisphaerales bacterium]